MKRIDSSTAKPCNSSSQMAPVAVFAYKRLDHVKRTLQALQNNIFAEDTEIFVFSDGARSLDDNDAVKDVRSYLGTVAGFRKTTIIEREKNLGLANNIIAGVTDVVNRYGKIIVVEDDIVTSKFFLKYMNEALNIYESYPNVMEIAGYTPPINKNGIPETFFSKLESCWGWGTWKRSWDLFKRDPAAVRDSFSEEEIAEFSLDGMRSSWEQILLNCSGRLYTWAVFWAAAIYKNNGLCLYSSESMTRNIGMDGSGIHRSTTDAYDVRLAEKPVTQFTLEFLENQLARKNWKTFMASVRSAKG